MDKKYLEFELNDLNREKKVVSVNYNDSIYWKYNNSESIVELKINFCLAILDEDPFDAWIWYKLGNYYLEKTPNMQENLNYWQVYFFFFDFMERLYFNFFFIYS